MEITNKIKITFPPLGGGQSRWSLYQTAPKWETPPDSRTVFQKLAYKTLTWLHNHAETFWHWCWYKSRDYAAPKSKIVGEKHFKIGDFPPQEK